MPDLSSVTKYTATAQEGFASTLNGSIDDNDTTIAVTSLSGYSNGDIVFMTIDATDSGGTATPSLKEVVYGEVSSNNLINCIRGVEGTAQAHSTGANIVDYVSASHQAADSIWKNVEHNQDGTHSDITATSVTVDTLTINSTENTQGYSPLGDVPDTVTYNGNRSYDLVFNSNDLTDTVSNGMRLKLTRTVTAPTQCADLEASSSQYFTKTSPSGISFTVTWTAMAWVKLESYTEGGIISRRNGDTEGWHFGVNADGRLEAGSLRIASNNSVTRTYQSLPLGKWVHVAAATDLAGTTLLYIDGVLVPSSTIVNGTCTALVQGTTALNVGAQKSDGTFPFDGKIAQVAIYSAKVTQANIRSYMSQGLSGSETSLVSAYSFNNSITDLVTGTGNDLTAQGGAVATNADSPFGLQADGTTAGTTDYGIITKTAFSTNTTLTVQVPEGNAIPTSGGVSAVSYSTQKVPYGFPADEGRWRVQWVARTSTAQNSPVNGTWYNLDSTQLNIPVGSWLYGYEATLYATRGNSSGTVEGQMTISTANNSVVDTETSSVFYSTGASSGVAFELLVSFKKEKPLTTTAATTYYLNSMFNTAGGTALQLQSSRAATILYAKPAHL